MDPIAPAGDALPERPLASVQAVIDQGVTRGERAVAGVRIVGACMTLLAIVANYGVAALLTPNPRLWASASGLIAAALLSIWDLRRLRSRLVSRAGLWLSVALDTATITAALLPVVIWTRPSYPGALFLPGFYFYGLAISMAGLRLDRRLVHWAVALNLGAAGLALGLDLTLNGPPPLFQPGDAYLAAALLLASIALGYAIADRTRALVLDGSAAVLRAERARQALGVYVSETVAEQALAGEALRLGGERREVAVLFSDLRGFTAYSETLPPEGLVGEINAYLDRMVEVIRDEGGVVDKYIGDAIMVVFGVPEARPDDAARAVRCAARMQAALEEHNRERAAAGQPPLRQGIGVHYGEVIAGNIGSADRLQYTVMGSTVNLASRLEGATKTEGVAVLVSGAVVAAMGDGPAVARRGWIELRGAEEAVEVYTLA